MSDHPSADSPRESAYSHFPNPTTGVDPLSLRAERGYEQNERKARLNPPSDVSSAAQRCSLRSRIHVSEKSPPHAKREAQMPYANHFDWTNGERIGLSFSFSLKPRTPKKIAPSIAEVNLGIVYRAPICCWYSLMNLDSDESFSIARTGVSAVSTATLIRSIACDTGTTPYDLPVCLETNSIALPSR